MTPTLCALTSFTVIELWRDRSFRIAVCALACASVAASCNGLRETAAVDRAIADARALAAGARADARRTGQAILDGREPAPAYWLNPADVRGFAYYELIAFAVKPPALAAPLSLGSLDVLPSVVRVLASSTAPFAQAYTLDNPHRLALGRIDPAFVVVYLLPLVIVVLGHSVLATERRGGRLAVLAVHGVTPPQLVAARLGARGTVIAAVAIGGSVLPVALASGGRVDAAMTAWIGISMSYAALWSAATAIVVGKSRSHATAATALGALWVVTTVVAPWTLAATAEAIYPPPSRVEQILQERAAVDGVEAQGAGAINRYVSEHPELGVPPDAGAKDFYTAQQLAFNAAVEERLAATDGALERQLARRQAFVDRLSWAVPSVLAAEAMTDVSGTGWRRHRELLGQGRAYVAALRAYFDPKALAGDFVFRDWDGWPQYAWREPPATPALGRAAAAMAGLIAAAIVLARWAARALGRVSPL